MNFNFDALLEFIAAFFKKMLDNFQGMSDWADKFLGEEETTNA